MRLSSVRGAALLAVLGSLLAFAGAPARVNLQGVLRNDAGGLQDGTFTFKVELFPDPASTTPFLTEEYNNVPVTSGVFTLEVGSKTDANALAAGLSAATDPQVVISVNGAALPKQSLASVTYALHAKRAEGVNSIAQCPAGQVLKGVENGAPVCVGVQERTAVDTISCPSGLVQAIAADGTATCVTLVTSYTAGNTASAGNHGHNMWCGQYTVQGTSGSGTASATCPSGYQLTGGGCRGSVAMKDSHAWNNTGCTGICPIGCIGAGPCFVNSWSCTSTSSTDTVTAYAICCSDPIQ